ncbi:MAG TPA: phosphoribulokinase [Ktedonobacteraceae bacterium]|nr:phosphoribulokinase [Ktedonobacteraceae bacterium]
MATSIETVPRPIILGIVGDSAAGKTTLSRGIAQILGAERASILCTDDYHRYNRQQRKELGITPLHADCNYLDIMAQHLRLLRAGEPILKPHYNHQRGDFDAPQYIVPRPFLIIEGLLGFYSKEMRNAYSVRVYLNPSEDVRRRWKLWRDSHDRGYTEEEVQRELIVREPDSVAFIQPQRHYADIEVSFFPDTSDWHPDIPVWNRRHDDAHLNVRLTLHGTLPHPDFGRIIEEDQSGCVRSGLGRENDRAVEYLEIDGSIPDGPAATLERGILSHLDACGAASPTDLGQYFDSQVRHSHPLALTELFLVSHLLRARQREAVEV